MLLKRRRTEVQALGDAYVVTGSLDDPRGISLFTEAKK